jgi:hypothetical protein
MSHTWTSKNDDLRLASRPLSLPDMVRAPILSELRATTAGISTFPSRPGQA